MRRPVILVGASLLAFAAVACGDDGTTAAPATGGAAGATTAAAGTVSKEAGLGTALTLPPGDLKVTAYSYRAPR